MSLFVPPPPVLIGGGGGSGGGSSLNTSDSSVILTSDETHGTSSVVISTSNTPAIVVSDNQNVWIGDPIGSSIYRLVVDAPNQYCLELSNNPNNSTAAFTVSSTGVLSIITSGNDINLSSNQIRFANNSLYLGGAQVLTTADELNYLKSTRGTGSADKALVLDSDSSIGGINVLSATSISGTLQTAYQPSITQLDTININNSLSLAGILISSTASELNYVHITPGTTNANKAMILDSDKSISGINILSASYFDGILQTAAQPNITSVGTLSALNISGWLGVGTTNPSTDVEIYSEDNPILKLNNGTTAANITIDINGNLRLNPDGDLMLQSNHSLRLNGTGEISGAISISATNLTGTIQTADQPNITSIGTLSTLVVTDWIGLGTSDPAKKIEIFDEAGDCIRLSRTNTEYVDLTLNSSGDLLINPVGTNIRLSSGTSLRFNSGSISGVDDFAATTISGTIQTADQPNITSIGILDSLNVSNTITCDTITANEIDGTIQTAFQPNITAIGILTHLSITGILNVGTVSAATLSGTIQTASQPNITSIGTLTNLTVSNILSVGIVDAANISGVIQTVSQPHITSIGTLTNLTVSNTLNVSTVSATNLNGTIQTAAQPNITAIGTLNTLSVTNGIDCSSLTATNLTGTLQTAAQPNITSLGILSSLSVTNGIGCASLTATNLTGTIQTASQPNIRTLGTLTNIYTSGKIGINTTNPLYDIDIVSADGNAIQVGYNETLISISASSTGDIVLTTDGQRVILANGTSLRFSGGGSIIGLTSLTATNINGTIQTAAQPNITSLGMMNYLESASIRIGPAHTSTYSISVSDSSGRFLSLTDGTVIVTERIIDGEYLISSSTGRVGLAMNVDLALNGGTILGLTTLTVGGFTVTGDQLSLLESVATGTVAPNSLLAADSSSNLVGFNQLGATTLTLGAVSINSSQLSLLTTTTPGTATPNTILMPDLLGNIVGFNNISTTSLTVGGNNISGATFALLENITVGVVIANTVLAADSNLNLTGFNNLTATNLYGTIQTAAQTNITSVGTLSSLNVTGNVGIGTQMPDKKVDINSPTGNCLRLSYNKAVSSTNYADFIVSPEGNLSIISSGGTTVIDTANINKLIIGNTSNYTLPIEVGYQSFVLPIAFAYNTNTNSHGLIGAGNTTSYNYSIRALGRIMCTQSLDVISDRRVKYNINELTDEYCTKFVKETTPVSFNMINGDNSLSHGYVAQDLLRYGFDSLVNLIPDDTMEQEIDDDGLISPAGIKFTIAYEHIIPILAKNQKRLMEENQELTQKIDKLLEMIQQLMK